MAARKLVQKVSQRSGWLPRKNAPGAVVQFRTERVAKMDGRKGLLRPSSL